jgi:hypothetical protein
MTKVTIFRIDLQNGNSTKAVKSFECNKTIPEGRLRSYKARLKQVFERRLNRHLSVSLRYKDEESKYNEGDDL